MKHILKLILLIHLTIVSCVDNKPQNEKINEEAKVDTTHRTSKIENTTLSNNDTLIISKKAAIFIEPDSLRIEKRKKEVGEENFYIGADDYLFYMNESYKFLDSAKMTVLETKDKHFLKFVQTDKTVQVINLDKLPELWNIYFFDPAKKTKKVDMTAIDEEYKNYFEFKKIK